MLKRLFAGLSKKAPLPTIMQLQDTVVRGVVSNITDLQDGEWEAREWVYLAVNHEVLVEEGRRSSTQAAVLAHAQGGELEHLCFRLSPQTKADILALREAMSDDARGPWTILDLTVARSGQYNFAFSYTPPPRLNGDLLHQPLNDLLQRYLAQNEKP